MRCSSTGGVACGPGYATRSTGQAVSATLMLNGRELASAGRFSDAGSPPARVYGRTLQWEPTKLDDLAWAASSLAAYTPLPGYQGWSPIGKVKAVTLPDSLVRFVWGCPIAELVPRVCRLAIELLNTPGVCLRLSDREALLLQEASVHVQG